MQTFAVQAFGSGSNVREARKPSSAKQLRLDTRRKDAALWATPERYHKSSPSMVFARESRSELVFHQVQARTATAVDPSPRKEGPFFSTNDAWRNITPDERLNLLNQLEADNVRYRIELQALNARMPLSLLVDVGRPSCKPWPESVDSESDSSEFDASGSSFACR